MEGQGLIGMYGRECECVSCEPCRELRGRKRIGAQLAYRCLDRLHLSFQLGLEGSVQDTDRVFQCSPTDPQGSCESHFNPVSYTHLRAHETGRNLVCRLL